MPHTVHYPLRPPSLGALLSWYTVCGTGGYTYYHIWQVELARRNDYLRRSKEKVQRSYLEVT